MNERTQTGPASGATGGMGKMLKVRMVRSAIGGTRRQRESLRGLGLKGIGSSAIVQDTSAARGLIRCVAHLLTVED